MTTAFEAARERLRKQKVTLTVPLGEYRVQHIHSKNGFITDNLQKAEGIGEMLANNPPPEPEKPMGPLPRNTKAAFIRHWNKRLLEKRRKRQAAQIEAEVTAKVRRKS